MPQAYARYLIMKEMGWTYQELMDCPAHVYNEITSFMHTEALHAKETRT